MSANNLFQCNTIWYQVVLFSYKWDNVDNNLFVIVNYTTDWNIWFWLVLSHFIFWTLWLILLYIHLPGFYMLSKPHTTFSARINFIVLILFYLDAQGVTHFTFPFKLPIKLIFVSFQALSFNISFSIITGLAFSQR